METIQLTRQDKRNLNTTEIAKLIRTQLKKEFSGCKFSVTTEYYSMGSSIHLGLVESNIKVIREFKEISEVAILQLDEFNRQYIEETQGKKYHQLSESTLRGDFNINKWCNGIFLTEEGFKLLKRAVQIVDQYNYDESDSRIDYFDVNFYLHLSLGTVKKDLEENI